MNSFLDYKSTTSKQKKLIAMVSNPIAMASNLLYSYGLQSTSNDLQASNLRLLLEFCDGESVEAMIVASVAKTLEVLHHSWEVAPLPEPDPYFNSGKWS